MWQGRGVLFLSLKMSQNSIDDSLLLDTGDDPDRSAAATTELGSALLRSGASDRSKDAPIVGWCKIYKSL